MKPRLAALSLCLLLAACEPPLRFNAVDLTGQDYGPALRLPDASGRQRTLADFRGKVVVVFFGFTQCPDACPTSLALLAELTRQLGEDGGRLQTLFVTVDPERDSAALVSQYAAAFHPDFLALRGSAAETASVARAFKVFHEKRGDIASGRYTIDHTAGLYVFDPRGRTRLFVPHGEAPERLLADLRLLLAGR